MAITIRVPDPSEQYDVGNQRQIVRAVNTAIGQINAQYKPEGDTFAEIEQLSYFLGYAPSTSSGPDTGGGGLAWENIVGFLVPPVTDNRGYIVDTTGLPDPVTFNLPAPSKTGFKVGFLHTGGAQFIQVNPAPGSNIQGAPFGISLFGVGESVTLVWDINTTSWWKTAFFV